MEGKERIPVELVKQWILELCDILEYLHNNRPPILYLDLKPENIMIQEEGKLRLIDFGSVQYKYQIKKLSGTIGYAPKELINREKDKIDEQSDIYSLGMIFHYLLTGKSPTHPPFQREKVSYYQKDISPQLERVVETALSTKKTKRYQSIQEFRNAIYKSDIKQDRKKITDFISVVFYYILVSLSAILLGIGLEGIVYENLEGYQRYFWWGCLLVTGSICWRKVILNNGVKKQKKYVMHKSILITDKKQIGLWLILVIISWSIQFW